jgi:hypothetical protein
MYLVSKRYIPLLASPSSKVWRCPKRAVVEEEYNALFVAAKSRPVPAEPLASTSLILRDPETAYHPRIAGFAKRGRGCAARDFYVLEVVVISSRKKLGEFNCSAPTTDEKVFQVFQRRQHIFRISAPAH